jgi:hypothetical protein
MPTEPLLFEYPSLVDEHQRRRLEQWHLNGADPALKPAERGIWLPSMSPGKLDRLLQKARDRPLTDTERETLKDYKYLLLAQPHDALEKGFMILLLCDQNKGENPVLPMVPKNAFWLTHIEHALESRPPQRPRDSAFSGCPGVWFLGGPVVSGALAIPV